MAALLRPQHGGRVAVLGRVRDPAVELDPTVSADQPRSTQRRPVQVSTPTAACGTGRPASARIHRSRASPGVTTHPSATSSSRLAVRTPRFPALSRRITATTPRSAPIRSADSTTTAACSPGSVRAQSTRVRSSVVTGTPSRIARSRPGSAVRCRRTAPADARTSGGKSWVSSASGRNPKVQHPHRSRRWRGSPTGRSTRSAARPRDSAGAHAREHERCHRARRASRPTVRRRRRGAGAPARRDGAGHGSSPRGPASGTGRVAGHAGPDEDCRDERTVAGSAPWHGCHHRSRARRAHRTPSCGRRSACGRPSDADGHRSRPTARSRRTDDVVVHDAPRGRRTTAGRYLGESRI